MRKCAAAFYFTLGFVAVCTTEASTGSCDCPNWSSITDKCNNTEGVYDFTCFIKHKKPQSVSVCEWKHKGESTTSYTLYRKQRVCKCEAVDQKNAIWTSTEINVINRALRAHVIVTIADQSRCTYNWSGEFSEMTLCGPHGNVSFKRSSGHLSVQVDWGIENKYIKIFTVKYREFNSTRWKEQQSINNRECVIQHVTPSLSYELQIQCVPNTDCAKCALSEVITVPQELTDAPSIQWEIEDHMQNHLISTGQRKVVVMWEYEKSEAVDYYNVTVRKITGESISQDSFKTEELFLTLILSYSAYNISIRASNIAGSSPVSSVDIEQMDEWRDSFGPLSVNITSNNSFILSWSSSVSSVCYLVEWWTKGQIPAFRSFYLNETHKKFKTTTESAFEPYTRYYFLLHTRPEPETCNMKNVNNSETTYGTAQAYLTEGSPVSAPGNVSILNITQHSAVITWTPVAEEDLHGFLLGYYIYYKGDNNEISVNVDPSINSYELLNLESSGAYGVWLSAFTAAGEGERSDSKHFLTHPPAEFTTLNSIIAAVIVGVIILLIAVHISCRFLHRAKNLVWPSIPNPENSNAVQKIEIAYEMGILEPLNRQRLEESEGCDSSTVCVIDHRRRPSPLSSPPASQASVKRSVLLYGEDEDGQSILEEIKPPEASTSKSIPTFPLDFSETGLTSTTSADIETTSLENTHPGDSISNMTKSDSIPAASGKPAVVFMSDYTTMEIFQQVTMNGIQTPSVQTTKPGFASVHPGQDYVRQSCLYRNKQSSHPQEACTEALYAETAKTLSSSYLPDNPLSNYSIPP